MASHFIKRLRKKIDRMLPVRVKIVYYKFTRSIFSSSSTRPIILSGRLLRRLRSEIHRNKYVLALGEVATNCGLLRLGDEYLGVFKNGTFNFCWEMGLNDNVDPGLGIRQTLYIAKFNNDLCLREVTPLTVETTGLVGCDPEHDLLEDVRLIHNGKEVVMVINHVPAGGSSGAWPKQVNAWPLIGVLDLSRNATRLFPVRLSGIRPPQKNWIPFAAEGETFLQYSIVPHRILRVDPYTGHCDEAWLTRTNHQALSEKCDFKGGAPLVALGDQLLGACHSWFLNKDDEREYLTYFYLTQAEPPFAVTQISPPLKILIPDRIQYLLGMVLDAPQQSLVMSYGVNDCDNYFVEISLTKIFALFPMDQA